MKKRNVKAAAVENRDQHVTKRPDGWAVVRHGSTKATRTYKTQQEAIEHGELLAYKYSARLFIHKSDGTVRKTYDYRRNKKQRGEENVD